MYESLTLTETASCYTTPLLVVLLIYEIASPLEVYFLPRLGATMLFYIVVLLDDVTLPCLLLV